MSDIANAVRAALPQLTVQETLGSGAFGVVLAAEQPLLDRQVAIKCLRADHASDAGMKRRFLTEARVLSKLQHPHIVLIYEYREVDDLCLLVMERLDGGSVRDIMKKGAVDPATACAIALVVCSALESAHAQRVLHRDIKPANLLFSENRTLKVTDFGIAKVLEGIEDRTAIDTFLGTPSYMAPEQVLGEQLGPAVDIYATATLLYELLSGQLPHSREGGAIAVARRQLDEAPRPLGEVAPALPDELVAVVMRGLARSPRDRWPTAQEFGVDIALAAARNLGSGWLERSPVQLSSPGPILTAANWSALPRMSPSPPTPAADATSLRRIEPPEVAALNRALAQPAPPPVPRADPAPPVTAAPAAPRVEDVDSGPHTFDLVLGSTGGGGPDRRDSTLPLERRPSPRPGWTGRILAGLAIAAAVLVFVGTVAYAINNGSHGIAGSGRETSAGTPSTSTSTTGSASASATPSVPTLPDFLSVDRSSLVRIVISACQGGASSTGFLIAPNLVATAASAVFGRVATSVTPADGHPHTSSVIGLDQAHDLALIQTASPIQGVPLTFASAVPAAGSAVAVLGFPQGKSFAATQTPGLLGPVATAGRLAVKLAPDSGNVGAPVLDAAGHVAGVVGASPAGASALSAADSATAAPIYSSWTTKPQPVATQTCARASGPSNVPVDPGLPDSTARTAAVSKVLGTYFTAIDKGDYVTAFAQLSPAVRSQTTQQTFSANEGTTFDYDVVLHSVAPAGGNAVLAYVTLTSVQAGSHGPNPNDTCDTWSIDETLAPDSAGTFTITHAVGHAGGPIATRCI